MQKNVLHTTQPIGIFDSGIGGLTVTQCIEKHLPQEELIYFADHRYAPYGNKPISFIEQRVNQVADYFITQNVKAIVIACNTATVNAIDQLRQRIPISIPIIGVEPAIKPAAQQSKTQKIAILVTQATSTNKRFLALVEKHKNGSDVYIQACPGLVELIEQGDIYSQQTQSLLEEFLIPLRSHNIDTLVLGCTHYPVLNQQIQSIIGHNISLIDTALPVTNQLKKQLIKHNLLNLGNQSKPEGSKWFTSQLFTPKVDHIFNKNWQEIII